MDTRTKEKDSEIFRRYGHEVVDWIANYLQNPGQYPVLSQVAPGEIRRALPDHAPEQPEAMETVLADFKRIILPGITHLNSPGFMGYFGLGPSVPAILARMLEVAMNQTRIQWRTSPAGTELEQVALDWLRQMLGLPGPLWGMIHTNSAIRHALFSALVARSEWKVRERGLAGRPELPRLRCYASQEAHSSVDKAAMVLGIGQEGLRKIPTDEAFRMDVEELERAILQDIRAGWAPFAVVATVGTTSATSIDPVPQIATICERYGLWLHVDAAYAGAAALVPELRVLDGCERADSLTVNPHKWLSSGFGSSVLYTRHPATLRAAFNLLPAYLQSGEHDGGANLYDFTDQIPHGFPALDLWMVLRYFGTERLAARIAEHCRLAAQLARWIDESPSFERLAPTTLSVVSFRAHPRGLDNEEAVGVLNRRLMNAINSAGQFLISDTTLGKYALHASIGNWQTEERHVCGLWQELQETLAKLVKELPDAEMFQTDGRAARRAASGGVV